MLHSREMLVWQQNLMWLHVKRNKESVKGRIYKKWQLDFTNKFRFKWSFTNIENTTIQVIDKYVWSVYNIP